MTYRFLFVGKLDWKIFKNGNYSITEKNGKYFRKTTLVANFNNFLSFLLF